MLPSFPLLSSSFLLSSLTSWRLAAITANYSADHRQAAEGAGQSSPPVYFTTCPSHAMISDMVCTTLDAHPQVSVFKHLEVNIFPSIPYNLSINIRRDEAAALQHYFKLEVGRRASVGKKRGAPTSRVQGMTQQAQKYIQNT